MIPRGVAIARVVLAALTHPSVPATAVVPRWFDARTDVLTAGDPLAATALEWADLVAVGGTAVGPDRRRPGARPPPAGGTQGPGDAERPDGAERPAAERSGAAAAVPGRWGAGPPATDPATDLDQGARHAPSLRPPEPPGGGEDLGPRVAGPPGPVDEGLGLDRPPRRDGVPPGLLGGPPAAPAPAAHPITAVWVVERIAQLASALLAGSGTEHRARPGPRRRAAAPASAPLAQTLLSPLGTANAAAAPPLPATAAAPDRSTARGTRPALPAVVAEPVVFPEDSAGPAPAPPAVGGWRRPAGELLDLLTPAADRPGAREEDAATGSAGAHQPAPGPVPDAEALAEAVAAVLADQARRHGVELP